MVDKRKRPKGFTLANAKCHREKTYKARRRGKRKEKRGKREKERGWQVPGLSWHHTPQNPGQFSPQIIAEKRDPDERSEETRISSIPRLFTIVACMCERGRTR
jgi:hypothetical protein